MFKGFKDFIVEGNVVNLSVAVALGAAFGKVVEALIGKVLMPLIAGLFGQPNFDNILDFTVNNSRISIGVVITAMINFLLISATMYFVIVVPYRKLNTYADIDDAKKDEEIKLLRDIRNALVNK